MQGEADMLAVECSGLVKNPTEHGVQRHFENDLRRWDSKWVT